MRQSSLVLASWPVWHDCAMLLVGAWPSVDWFCNCPSPPPNDVPPPGRLTPSSTAMIVTRMPIAPPPTVMPPPGMPPSTPPPPPAPRWSDTSDVSSLAFGSNDISNLDVRLRFRRVGAQHTPPPRHIARLVASVLIAVGGPLRRPFAQQQYRQPCSHQAVGRAAQSQPAQPAAAASGHHDQV